MSYQNEFQYERDTFILTWGEHGAISAEAQVVDSVCVPCQLSHHCPCGQIPDQNLTVCTWKVSQGHGRTRDLIFVLTLSNPIAHTGAKTVMSQIYIWVTWKQDLQWGS